MEDTLRTDDYQCPWTKEEQRRILEDALEEAFGSRQVRDRADELAWALQDRLAHPAKYGSERGPYAGEQGQGGVERKEEITEELNRLRRRLDDLKGKLQQSSTGRR